MRQIKPPFLALVAMVSCAAFPLLSEAEKPLARNKESADADFPNHPRVKPTDVTLIVSKEARNDQVAMQFYTELPYQASLGRRELFIRFNGPINILGTDNPFASFGPAFQGVQVYYGYDSVLLKWKADLQGRWRKEGGVEQIVVLSKVGVERSTAPSDENLQKHIDSLITWNADLKAQWLNVGDEATILVLKKSKTNRRVSAAIKSQERAAVAVVVAPEPDPDPISKLGKLQQRLQNLFGKGNGGGVAPSSASANLSKDELVVMAQDLAGEGFWREALEKYERALQFDPLDGELIQARMDLMRQHTGSWKSGISYYSNTSDNLLREEIYSRLNFSISNRWRLTAGLELNHTQAPDPWRVDTDLVTDNMLHWGIGLERIGHHGDQSTLYLAGHLKPGLLLTHSVPWQQGGWEAKIKLHYPETGELSGQFHRAQRDQVGIGRFDDWGETLHSSLFASVNRYHTQSHSSAAKSVSVDFSGQWRPEGFPLFFGYALAWENPSGTLIANKDDGSSFTPYPRPRKENHTISIGWEDNESAILTRSAVLSDIYDGLSYKHTLALALAGQWYWQDDYLLGIKIDFGMDIAQESSQPFFFLSLSQNHLFL